VSVARARDGAAGGPSAGVAAGDGGVREYGAAPAMRRPACIDAETCEVLVAVRRIGRGTVLASPPARFSVSRLATLSFRRLLASLLARFAHTRFEVLVARIASGARDRRGRGSAPDRSRGGVGWREQNDLECLAVVERERVAEDPLPVPPGAVDASHEGHVVGGAQHERLHLLRSRKWLGFVDLTTLPWSRRTSDGSRRGDEATRDDGARDSEDAEQEQPASIHGPEASLVVHAARPSAIDDRATAVFPRGAVLRGER
jgi:hypothetical protein